jgi:hypothetical protein
MENVPLHKTKLFGSVKTCSNVLDKITKNSSSRSAKKHSAELKTLLLPTILQHPGPGRLGPKQMVGASHRVTL